MKTSHWLCWWCVLSYYVEAQDSIVVLRQGRVVGTRIFTTSSPFPIESFFGIPYAIAPVGRHRFAAPERHPGWDRTLYARRLPPRCPQLDDDGDGYFNEDCLFLNICTPRRPRPPLLEMGRAFQDWRIWPTLATLARRLGEDMMSFFWQRAEEKRDLPVVVILYSDTWSHKGPPNLPCQELAAEGIVVVNIAYRLHLLGFFTLKSKLARGNLALLDQYMALMWVRENIAEFGGDPAAITLLGHSAGADSILFHMASPRTHGLFQRAILMSPRSIWRSITSDSNSSTEVERSSREAARQIGCAGDVDTILRCMQTRSLADIMKLYSRGNWSIHMGPVVEDFLSPSEQYLPTDLYEGLSSTDTKSPHIDVLFGTTDLDAINSDEIDYKELESRGTPEVLDYVSHQIIPEMLRLHDLDGSPAISALVEAIFWEYWGPRALRSSQESHLAVEALARLKTSAQWGAGAALLAAKLARKVASLYMYRYSQPGQVDLQGRQLNYSGAIHGTDFISLLGDGMLQQLARRRPTSEEQRDSAYLRNYIVNFIKFGSPTSTNEWPQYRVGAAHLHDLRDSPPRHSHGEHTAGREVAFWLQYLPYINNLHSTTERSESLNSNKEDTRLRGAVYALVGVASALLALLCLGAALLRRERIHSGSGIDD